MRKILKFLKIFSILTIFFSFFFVVLVLFVLWKYSPELPSYEELKNYNPSLTTRVFTSDGLLLDKYFIEERLFVPIDRIPITLINAFLSAEDKKFYKHFGIDLTAIFRASFRNIYNKLSNKRLIGASTITQQVVKNLLLSNEVSLERKIKEMILAIRLEIILPKNKILELYLNDIYLGYGSYGVAAASLNYFNKSLQELELDEMSYLASLPKAPNNYNPKTKYSQALERRNWVLNRMFENNFINIDDLISYRNKKLVVKDRYENKFEEAKYFREEIRKQLNNLFGSQKLYSQGFIIKTTIDTKLQKIADEVFINGLMQYDMRQGWRGPLLTSYDKLIFSLDFQQSYKNPFPKKWKLSQVIEIDKKFIKIVDKKSKEKNIYFENGNKWLSKVEFQTGDIFFTEENSEEVLIRQIPNANGGIIVMDPHTGKVLAITGGFSFNLS